MFKIITSRTVGELEDKLNEFPNHDVVNVSTDAGRYVVILKRGPASPADVRRGPGRPKKDASVDGENN